MASEVLWFEFEPAERAPGLVDVWLSTEAEHDPIKVVTCVSPRVAYRVAKAAAEALRLGREFELDGTWQHRDNGVHVKHMLSSAYMTQVQVAS